MLRYEQWDKVAILPFVAQLPLARLQIESQDGEWTRKVVEWVAEKGNGK